MPVWSCGLCNVKELLSKVTFKMGINIENKLKEVYLSCGFPFISTLWYISKPLSSVNKHIQTGTLE